MKATICFFAVLVLMVIHMFVDNKGVRGVIYMFATAFQVCGIILAWEALIVNVYSLFLQIMLLVITLTFGPIYLFEYRQEKSKNK